MLNLPEKTYLLRATACSILLLALALFLSSPCAALTPQQRFFQADRCYKSLQDNPTRMKYRHHWLSCIHQYEEVYHSDPDGAWAAAGLYQAGVLYSELYRRSYLKSDRQEALDRFERILKRFPDSAYKSKAESALQELQGSQAAASAESSKAERKETASPESSDIFRAADACYRDLKGNRARQKYRDRWMRCIQGFEEVTRTDPSGPWAAAGLYMAGKLYQELYRHSYRDRDLQEARDRFQRVVDTYPRSQYQEKAKNELAAMTGGGSVSAGASPSEETRAAATAPGDDEDNAPPSVEADKPETGGFASAGPVAVTGLRYWSNPNYTRVVIDAADETGFADHLLKEDPSLKKPPRLFVDLSGAALDKDLEKSIPINDNLLSNVRAGQYTADTVRVVIDIKSFKTYKIFSLKNPFRIVIDVWGEESEEVVSKPAVTAKSGQKLPPNALAKQFALGVSKIVIDPGHGGKDYGAPGYLKGVHEKDVVLSIARRLEKAIRQEIGCEVVLTRTGDRYLTLEERTAFANTQNADLFISIHTNSHRDRRAHGIETYFLNLATDNDAIMVAATENATSEKNISDLQTILLDLMQNAKINESSRLAVHVQSAVFGHLKVRYNRVQDKGVKQAPFYVLLGAQMPAVLIETSFISNERECRRLVSPEYQDQLCEGIVRGIKAYIRENQPTAHWAPSERSGGG